MSKVNKTVQTVRVNITMPLYLKDECAKAAAKKGVPTNEFIRDALKFAIRESLQ